MTLKTRWFGKKVEGEPLKNLVSALGENPDRLLQTSNERWSTSEVHGRVNFTPTNEGVNVDLYIFREDYHIKDGTLNLDSLRDLSLYSERSPFSFNESKERFVQLHEKHIQGEIKYTLDNKIKSGTGTGIGELI